MFISCGKMTLQVRLNIRRKSPKLTRHINLVTQCSLKLFSRTKIKSTLARTLSKTFLSKLKRRKDGPKSILSKSLIKRKKVTKMKVFLLRKMRREV